MSLSLNSLRLLENVLLNQPLSLRASDEEIGAVLTAKRELADAIAEQESAAA